MDSKGKQAAGKEPYRKRTRGNDSERADRGLKRRNRQVLQFFEDTAAVTSDDDSSDYFDSDMEEEFDPELKIKSEPGKASNFPLFPKEEEQDEEEFDRMMEERYKKGSGFVKYAEDDYESKKSIERKSFISDAKDPVIWKVKCMVGRERYSAFCLMQKFVDLQSLGTKLQIISAFAVEHVKGFVYIEADKQCDVMEACKGLCTIYSTRMIVLPRNEVYHLLSFQSKPKEVSEGMWARVKNGKYKGDLSQVVFMNDTRKKATIKLIPRIDLQAMAQKFGGGVRA